MAKRRRGDGTWRQPRGSVAQEPKPKWGARPPTVPWTSGAYRPDEAAKGRAKGKKLVGQYHFTPIRGSTDRKDPNDGLSREVADMLRMCTLAHRREKGNIVWLGWNGRSDGPSWLSNGSTAIAVSREGAQTIKEAFDAGKMPREHIDIMLRNWLGTEGEAYRSRACYIYPAVGSYYEHPSECDPKNFGEGKRNQRGGRSRARAKARARRTTTTRETEANGSSSGMARDNTGCGSNSQRSQSSIPKRMNGKHTARKSLPPPPPPEMERQRRSH